MWNRVAIRKLQAVATGVGFLVEVIRGGWNQLDRATDGALAGQTFRGFRRNQHARSNSMDRTQITRIFTEDLNLNGVSLGF